MSKPLGWIITGEHGWPYLDADGKTLVFATPEDAEATVANLIGPGGRVFELRAWKRPARRRHEYGTRPEGTL